MTIEAFILILISLFMHVGWNLLSKKSNPSGAFYMMISVAAVLAFLPCLLLAKIDFSALGARFWLFYFCSILSEFTYFFGLFKAYRRSDISIAYPMIRALPVILVAVVTMICGLGKIPGILSLFGMLVVFAGCLMMPLQKLSDFKLRSYITPSLKAIIIAACGTTGYTIFDSIITPELLACSTSGKLLTTGALICMLEIGITISMGLYVLCHKNEQQELRKIIADRALSPAVCGIFSAGAYVLILMAMPLVTNVSFVQAFRQMSLPLGVAAGVFILKEKCPMPRLLGIIVIVSGLILVAFGK